MMWNDGPEFISELTDPWAPHPVVNSRNVCCGGGSTSAPQGPDYTNFNAKMAGIGDQLTSHGNDLYNWARENGVKLSDLAKLVSDRAGGMADWATQGAKDTMANWQSTYGPIYQAAAKRTQDFMKDLPATMESWAGKYGADAATKIDQGKAALTRKLQGEGLSRPSVAQGAIDLAQNNQRSLAVTSASEAGRMAAMQYGDTLTGQTLQQGQIFPQVSGQLSGQGAAYGNQQVGAPESAISTTAGSYAPSTAMYQAGFPYNQSTYNAMQQTYANQLQAFNASQNASSGDFMHTVAPMILGMAGSAAMPAMQGGIKNMFGMGMGSGGAGPVTATGPVGSGPGGSYRVGDFPPASGGSYDTSQYARGGEVPMAGRTVPPGMSPSGGAHVDDVQAVVDGNPRNKAAINTGEFIIPRKAVEWYGEKFLQNLVAKSDKERSEQTVAAAQAGPPQPGALNMQPPMMGAPA